MAEKIHAYTRDYGRHDNTRVKDLYDMLVIADNLTLPHLGDLAAACATTFAIRGTPWPPPGLDPPPATWATPWTGFVQTYHVRFTSLEVAYDALAAFWQPMLQADGSAESRWDSHRWSWHRPAHG